MIVIRTSGRLYKSALENLALHAEAYFFVTDNLGIAHMKQLELCAREIPEHVVLVTEEEIDLSLFHYCLPIHQFRQEDIPMFRELREDGRLVHRVAYKTYYSLEDIQREERLSDAQKKQLVDTIVAVVDFLLKFRQS